MTDEQMAALYGPAAPYSEHKIGDVIRFYDGTIYDRDYVRMEDRDRILRGVIRWVRAAGQAVEGGAEHPVIYVVDAGQGWPVMVAPGEIVASG